MKLRPFTLLSPQPTFKSVFMAVTEIHGKTTENERMALFWVFVCLLFVFDSPFLWLTEFFAVGL